MRVVVLWADERSPNLGVRVLAAGATHAARRAWPGCEVMCQDFRPNGDGVAFDRTTILRDMRSRRGPVASVIQGADVILDTGAGDSFTDIYGRGRLLMLTHVRRQAASLGIPVVLLPQTYGPFTKPGSSILARRGLEAVSTAFSRDPVSTAYAADALRLRAIEATDVVFSLPAVRAAAHHDVLLNVSGLLWSGGIGHDPRPYRRTIVSLIEALREQGRRVSLLAHVLDNEGLDNDVRVMDEVSRAAAGELECVIPTSLDDARRHIAGAQLVVASRMHACLNSLSLGVPAIAMAYSRKFRPLLSALGWDAVFEIGGDEQVVRQMCVTAQRGDLEVLASRAASRGRAMLDPMYAELGSTVRVG